MSGSKYMWALTELSSMMRNRVGRTLNVPSAPKFISNAVTWKCNSRCSTCGIWRAPLPKTDDNKPEVYERSLLKDPLIKSARVWEMTGGEPVLYDGIFELTEMAFRYLPRTTQVAFATNGIALDRLKEFLTHFRKCPLHLSISIDGLNDVHDSVRGVVGNFDSIVDLIGFIRSLQRNGSKIQFGASVCVSKVNLDNIPSLIDWLNRESIPFQLTPVIFPNYAQSEYARRERSELDFVTPSERERVISLFGKFDRESYRIFISYWKGDQYPIVPCYALREYVHTRPDGTVETCMWKHYKVGNIREQTLSQIWTGEKAKHLRKVVKSCVECNRIHPNLCDSLNNYLFHGTLAYSTIRRGLLKKLSVLSQEAH